MLITILSLLGVLIVLVMAHECGHFFTARATKVKVEEFGLFFPPRLLSFKRGETRYSLNALPIGGFVKMAGEEDPDVPGSLASKPTWVRIAVLAAGSVMNAILPVLLFAIAFMVPHNVLDGTVVADNVTAGSPAAVAGIQPGDRLLAIHGRPVQNLGDVNRDIELYLGQEVDFTIERNGVTSTYRLAPRWQPPAGQTATGAVWSLGPVLITAVAPGSAAAEAGIQPGDIVLEVRGFKTETIDRFLYYLRYQDMGEDVIKEQPYSFVIERDGVVSDVTVTPYPLTPDGRVTTGLEISVPSVKESQPFWEAIPNGVKECFDTYVLFKNGIISIAIGAAPAAVAGPVGIAEITGEAARMGFSYLLQFAAFFSINLAIINIFPLPALDGGRIAFVLLEWVRGGKRVSPRIEGIVHTIGFFLLLAAMIAITYQDIVRILTGQSLIG